MYVVITFVSNHYMVIESWCTKKLMSHLLVSVAKISLIVTFYEDS